MCRRRRIVQPHVRGRWRGNHPRLEYQWSPDWLSPTGQLIPRRATIYLPFTYNKYGGNTKVTAGPEGPVLLLPTKGRSRKCRITRLPMEILLQIAEYLVPTDVSFHVFPSTWQPYGGFRSTVVHKFSQVAPKEEDRVIPGTHSYAREHLTALAQTCRVLSEAYYATIYGRNHFIVELSSHEVYPGIDGPATPPVESWTKVLRGKRQGMWPLTVRSVPYVRHLTILGTLHWEETKLAKTALRKHLLSAIELLKEAQSLNGLAVDLRRSTSPYGLTSPPQMQSLPNLEPQANRRLGWGVQEPQDTVLRLRDVTTHDNYPGLVEFWRLFEDLRGFQDVVLSGHIGAEMVEVLRAKMMREREPLQSGKESPESPAPRQPTRHRTRGQEKAAERQKSGSKRKRSIESSMPLKSRRRA